VTEASATKQPIGLREGLRRLSLGLVAYGTIGIIVALIGLVAFIWSLGRLEGASDRIDGAVQDISTTVHRTADLLTDSAATAGSVGVTLDSTAVTVDKAATTVAALGPTLSELETRFRDFGILGQHPLEPAANAVSTLRTNLDGLSQQLQDISTNLTDDHTALTENSASLAALATSLDDLAVRLDSGGIQSTIADLRLVLTVVLLMFVAWSAVPAVGALILGLWLRREVARGEPPAPVVAADDAPTRATPLG
jgi:hypothetical protein